jgi:hypothetical protein
VWARRVYFLFGILIIPIDENFEVFELLEKREPAAF